MLGSQKPQYPPKFPHFNASLGGKLINSNAWLVGSHENVSNFGFSDDPNAGQLVRLVAVNRYNFNKNYTKNLPPYNAKVPE